MLPEAGKVHEAKIDELDFLFRSEIEDGLRRELFGGWAGHDHFRSYRAWTLPRKAASL